MNYALVHPLTKQQIENFVMAPSHPILLTGPAGVGKAELAVGLAGKLLGEDWQSYPYKLELQPQDEKSIGIESARRLEHLLSLKVPRQTPVNRVVIIYRAHTLTPEAQNALLKTLEEPPAGSLIILTADNEQALLPTIRSRLQAIAVRSPERSQIEAYFINQGHAAESVSKTYTISGGLPGLMCALLEDAEHPLMEAVGQARKLLSLPVYDKLLLVDALSKQRDLALNTVNILQQMADVSMKTADGAAAARWQKVLEAGYRAAEALRTNAQPKLVLTELMLSL